MKSSDLELVTLSGVTMDHPVFPERPIDFVGGQPRLRSHLQNEGRLVFARKAPHQVETVIRIGRGNIPVERGHLAGGRGAAQTALE